LFYDPRDRQTRPFKSTLPVYAEKLPCQQTFGSLTQAGSASFPPEQILAFSADRTAVKDPVLSASGKNLLMVLIAFQPCSIAVEKNACSTPWTVAQTNRSVPKRIRPAKNEISIFMTLHRSFLHSINRHGKARASLIHAGRKNKWLNLRNF